jgi:hypothetical protein
MRKIHEVLRLHHECGRSDREVARAVQASPTTVADYLCRARLAEQAAKTWRRIRAPEKVAELLGGARYHEGFPVTDNPPEEQRKAA